MKREMIWVVGGGLALGALLCGLACVVANSSNRNSRQAAPLYWLPGCVLIASAVVLSIGNAAVMALL